MAFDINNATPVAASSRFNLESAVPVAAGSDGGIDLQAFAIEQAKRQGVDPDLVLSVMDGESTGGKDTRDSSKGAIGPMQLMPATFKSLGGKDIRNPLENIEKGVTYLSQLHDRFKDPVIAVAAYNAGPGAVKEAGGIPKNGETPGYVVKVMGAYGKRKQQQQVASTPPVAAATPVPATQTEPVEPSYTAGEPELDPQLEKEQFAGMARIPANIASLLYNVPKDLLTGKGFGLQGYRDTAAKMDAWELAHDIDPHSVSHGVGEFIGGAAATAPVGPALGAAAKAAKAPGYIVDALASGGFNVGDATGFKAGLARLLGGAATGEASTLLLNPDAGVGQQVAATSLGAMLPGAAGLVDLAKTASTPATRAMAERLMKYAGKSEADIDAALPSAVSEFVPDYKATVPQLLQSPEISDTANRVRSRGLTELDRAAERQDMAYRDALDTIAPINPRGATRAADDAGSIIGGWAAKEEEAARQAAGDLFQPDVLDPSGEAKVLLPVKDFKAIRNEKLGKGTFGQGGRVDDALAAARALSKEKVTADTPLPDSIEDLANPATSYKPRLSSLEELQNWRSSAGTMMDTMNPGSREYAALATMKKSLDDKLEAMVAGDVNGDIGEAFPESVAENYKTALENWSSYKARFGNGPQQYMFQRGSQGPAITGAAIPKKFFNGTNNQVRDITAFKRLTNGEPRMADALKEYAVTDAAATAGPGKHLGSGYVKWTEKHGPAIDHLFSKREADTIGDIAGLVNRDIEATAAAGKLRGSNQFSDLAADPVLNNPAIDIAFNKIPILGPLVGRPLLRFVRGTNTMSNNEILGKLLADPDTLKAALHSTNKFHKAVSSLDGVIPGEVLQRLPSLEASLLNANDN